jgi:anthranilate phosphoribosyltransferase
MPPDSIFPQQDGRTYSQADPTEARQRLSGYVATLGRGPGRSRSLTRDEARDALGLVLHGLGDPHQIGAMLMLLRYRGEDVEEIAGLVEAARGDADAGPSAPVALDWPSYGAGRTRGAPWFLLSALALAQSGVPVLMHGSNEFSSGMSVGSALAALGLAPASTRAMAAEHLDASGFAYLPVEALSPELGRLLALRKLLGLRSPINTVARLLNPFDAGATIDGVFHPPYIALHLGVAKAMGYRRLTVMKGAGGEAERSPTKRIEAHRYVDGTEPAVFDCPPLAETAAKDAMPADASAFAAIWRGQATSSAAEATVIGTIALALIALGQADDTAAADETARAIWQARHTG